MWIIAQLSLGFPTPSGGGRSKAKPGDRSLHILQCCDSCTRTFGDVVGMGHPAPVLIGQQGLELRVQGDAVLLHPCPRALGASAKVAGKELKAEGLALRAVAGRRLPNVLAASSGVLQVSVLPRRTASPSTWGEGRLHPQGGVGWEQQPTVFQEELLNVCT